jgi:spore maturation protein CgeB
MPTGLALAAGTQPAAAGHACTGAGAQTPNRMKIVVFGLAISSSWGNGHATLWRGLCRALADRGHLVVFFERDVPYYAAHRDLRELPHGRLYLYPDWRSIAATAIAELRDADAGIITSFCPDAGAAEEALLDGPRARKVFYDLDTAVTLDRLERGESVPYISANGLAAYDLVLSYTGGRSLRQLSERLGARRTAPLYGSVDPAAHQPVAPIDLFRADLSYLGTYADDRQDGVDRLFLAPARQRADRRFVLGGSQYPADFPWTPNIFYMRHVAPEYHPAFYSSSRLTLNVTRRAMADTGFCPSGRLFEAAACGAPVLSDEWEGLDAFFMPGEEILVAHDTADAVAALDADDRELDRIARAARDRTLSEHTAARRAHELEQLLEDETRVGNHSGRGRRHPDSAAGVLEGTAAGRLPD